ncbi:hypothetical protein Xedl_02159 [Xenorhabdus eapokensis]|uniref:DarT domain-containing protein n=2 Tax=Xenorhabdus eapokensis TaxID=1873482 RepID=A0A1Q5TR87_9GAMM|nr:hypothetical protein Xedl_02159 [Xenorhabdus eapokensis]
MVANMNYKERLNPEKALIWRIIHKNNLLWILQNGFFAGNSSNKSNDWVDIGNPELILKRANHPVPIAPGGTLNDYIPFYFTPFSPLLKNIHSGWGGIKQRPNNEIIILVSSLHKLNKLDVPFIFTDSHAYYMWSNFYSNVADLDKIDWDIIQSKDFKRDPDDLAKFERYQTEALIHNYCPVEALIGIVCYSEKDKQYLEKLIKQSGHNVQVIARPGWYFS